MRLAIRCLLALLLAATSAAAAVVVDWGGSGYVDADENVRGYSTPIEYNVSLGGGFTGARWHCPLSDVDPLTPTPSYNRGTNWRFYGGVLEYSYTNAFSYHWAEIWGAGPFGDQLYYGAPEGSHGWDFRYWKQPDFLAGGNATTVSFGTGSQIEILNYQGGDGVPTNNSGRVRAVVRDGGQFWISSAFGAPSTVNTASFVLSDPANALWASYNPSAPYGLQFNAGSASFATHAFSNITAVGYLHSNDNVAAPAVGKKAGFTFARFRVTATVGGGNTTGSLRLTKVKGQARFGLIGRDQFVVKGSIGPLPAGFDAQGQTVTIDVGGAQHAFTLDARGHAVVVNGSRVWLKVPAGFAGGSVPFSARIKQGSFADDWVNEGVNPNLTVHSAPLRFTVQVVISNTTYPATVSVRYTGTAHKRGGFKL